MSEKRNDDEPEPSALENRLIRLLLQDGTDIADLQRRLDQVEQRALAPPAAAAPDRSPFVRIDTLTEAVGLALADTETRATEALQQLRDELLARIAEIERRL